MVGEWWQWLCPKCDPSFQPAGDRQGEGHVAIRFGDRDRTHPDDWTITWNGEDVTQHCFEAIAGPAPLGKVWLWRTRATGKVLCERCHTMAAAEIREGEVTVRARMRIPS